MILTYPVQRHRFPERASRISCSEGSFFSSSNALADRIIPGTQNPHWTAPSSTKASWSGWSFPPEDSPSIVRISFPSAWIARMRQAFIAFPSMRMVQAPHCPESHPLFVPFKPRSSRRNSNRVVEALTVLLYLILLTSSSMETTSVSNRQPLYSPYVRSLDIFQQAFLKQFASFYPKVHNYNFIFPPLQRLFGLIY